VAIQRLLVGVLEEGMVCGMCSEEAGRSSFVVVLKMGKRAEVRRLVRD